MAKPKKPTGAKSTGRGRSKSGSPRTGDNKKAVETMSYKHPEATSLLRPEVGTQSQFRKKKPPATYRYDSSLSPALEWDGQNPAREQGEAHIRVTAEGIAAAHAELNSALEAIKQAFASGDGVNVAEAERRLDAAKAALAGAAEANRSLRAMSNPFLNWAGKAERLSFDVPTLPLFIHERLSTRAILETLKAHRRDKQMTMFDLYGDPQHPVADQVLKAYEFPDKWQNRLILGDSLVVMNSLLRYEGLGGQVQMIYMDPPYGIKYGSNFQPFVRKRDVKHNDDQDMTREPEMVRAYRDTWELGLHSYLTYLRDRLFLARDLLHPGGSILVQISDENVHHVRELLDEVFGDANFLSLIAFEKTSGATTLTIPTTCDYLLWYARDHERLKFRKLFQRKTPGQAGATEYKRVELLSGDIVPVSQFVENGKLNLPEGARLFATDSIVSKGGDDEDLVLSWSGKKYRLSCKPNRHWKPGPNGIRRLWDVGRLLRQEGLRIYKRYFEDFPFAELTHVWTDTRGEADPQYVVQTSTKIVERCMLMTTEPGDLVIDPTCGSGTTAYVAEQWGRRWIAIDTSRVPLALARQRVLTATFPYYELKDESRGPAGGFSYLPAEQTKNPKPVGPGIVAHIKLEHVANDQLPDEEVLVDRPEIVPKVTRVTGAFVVEATIPTPIDWDGDGQADTGVASSQDYGTFVDRMIEVLRRSPVLHLGGNKTVSLRNIRPPAKTLSLSAEALVVNGNGGSKPPPQPSPLKKEEAMAHADAGRPVAILFGPENGAVSEKAVYEAAREAHAKSYAHLYVIGFAIQPNARKLIDDCEKAVGVPATYVQATPDLMMGDLLKNMRSSQIFSVCGLPEVRLRKADANELKRMALDPKEATKNGWYQAELLGLDVFDPATMEVDHRPGSDVPCWMLDGDYNGLCFKASQVFFPRTAAWDDLKRALKAEYSESVWDHLAGTTSAPFQIGEHGQVAVKVIDDRGNELLVVKKTEEAER